MSDRWQLPIFGAFALFMVAPFLSCPVMLGPVTRSFTAEVFEVIYYEGYGASSVFTRGLGVFNFMGDMREAVKAGQVYAFTVERQRGGAWVILELKEVYS